MDALVVVGGGEPGEHLAARARRRIDVAELDEATTLIADLRSHRPRRVGVTGPAEAAGGLAAALHDAGLPVILYTDEPTDEVATRGVRVLPASDSGPSMEVADRLEDLVGNTPLVRLDRIGHDLDCHLLAKLELLNPGGSVKDRPALAMVDAAEREGLLQPGGTIVEPTSGNTGVGLALVAARRGYHCVFVMPDKMSPEKMDLLRAYGAEVVVCPTAVPPDHPDSYYSVAKKLAAERPGGYSPSQYWNQENPTAHEHSTGPEIWRQTAGRITHLVAGIGTGGTITGIGRYLKSQNPDVRIIGADPEGSVYSGGTGRPYLVEGIGEDFWPGTYDGSVVDEVVEVSDRDSFLMARSVTRTEGLLVGGSTGTAVWAALQVGRGLPPDAVVVVVVPDSGRGYLSKIYNEDWMADFGFLRVGEHAAGDVLGRKRTDLPALVHTHPDETVREAIEILREYDVSQLPVVQHEPPVVFGEMVGAVRDVALMEAAFRDPAVLDRPVADVMEPKLPTVGAGQPVDDVVADLEHASAVVVIDAGAPVGVLTRSDVLDFIAGSRARP
jgi:cystathionine beta-synthase